MRQIGNLAISCARRRDALLQVFNGTVTVFVGCGVTKTIFTAGWREDAKINKIIAELNHGCFKDGENQKEGAISA